jgi:hypothetical protein
MLQTNENSPKWGNTNQTSSAYEEGHIYTEAHAKNENLANDVFTDTK